MNDTHWHPLSAFAEEQLPADWKIIRLHSEIGEEPFAASSMVTIRLEWI